MIKRIKLIARPLLQGCNLSTSCWSHAVFHAVDLIQLRPTAYHTTFPLQLVCGDQPNISHLQKFGCDVPHRRMGIYVGFQSLSIQKYLEPVIGDLFTGQFIDCIFNKDHFSVLGENNKFINDDQKIDWDDKSILSSDPGTMETKLQVQKILELQQIASNLPNAFTDYKCVTMSLDPVVNAPCRVEVAIKTTPPLKRERSNQQKDTSNKRLKATRKTSSLKKVNASQSKVDGHQVDMINP
jgi:hypothetical protein